MTRVLSHNRRRRVGESAPLRNQFSERRGARWPGVQTRRTTRGVVKNRRGKLFNGKINLRKFCIVPRPTLDVAKNNGSQNFAALHRARLFAFLFRLRVKRALNLSGVRRRRGGGEGAVVKEGEPRTNGGRRHGAVNPRFHARFHRSWPGTAQPLFWGGSTSGATEAEPISSIGIASAGVKGFSPASSNFGCSTRVASSIALNNNAAAR